MKCLVLLLVSVVILSGCVSNPSQTNTSTGNTQNTGETKTVQEIVDSKTLTDFLIDPVKGGSEWSFDTTTSKEIVTLIKQDNIAQLRSESEGLVIDELEGKWLIVNDNLIISGTYKNLENPSDANNGKTLSAVFSCIKLNIVEIDATAFTAFYNITDSTPQPECSGESRTYNSYSY